MNLVVPDQQIVAGVASTLEWTYLDENGEAAVPVDDDGDGPHSGAVTVGVVRSDGTEVVADGTATSPDTTIDGRYTYLLSATLNPSLDVLTVSWAIDGTVVATTRVEVIGGFLFTVAEARASYAGLDNTAKYPTADIVKYRMITEAELNWICDRAFTPRFRRLTVDGTGTGSLLVPDNDLRAVSAVSVGGTAYGSTQLAGLKVYEHKRIDQPWGEVWEFDQENVEIAYSFGLDRPFQDLKEAALERFRELLWSKGKGLPGNASSMNGPDMTVQFDKPSEFETGNKLVDAVYRRRSLRTTAGADGAHPTPYGRTVSYPPQGSLFRGLR